MLEGDADVIQAIEELVLPVTIDVKIKGSNWADNLLIEQINRDLLLSEPAGPAPCTSSGWIIGNMPLLSSLL